MASISSQVRSSSQRDFLQRNPGTITRLDELYRARDARSKKALEDTAFTRQTGLIGGGFSGEHDYFSGLQDDAELANLEGMVDGTGPARAVSGGTVGGGGNRLAYTPATGTVNPSSTNMRVNNALDASSDNFKGTQQRLEAGRLANQVAGDQAADYRRRTSPGYKLYEEPYEEQRAADTTRDIYKKDVSAQAGTYFDPNVAAQRESEQRRQDTVANDALRRYQLQYGAADDKAKLDAQSRLDAERIKSGASGRAAAIRAATEAAKMQGFVDPTKIDQFRTQMESMIPPADMPQVPENEQGMSQIADMVAHANPGAKIDDLLSAAGDFIEMDNLDPRMKDYLVRELQMRSLESAGRPNAGMVGARGR